VSRAAVLKIVVAALLAAGLVWAVGHRDLFTDEALQAHLDALGGWAPLAFVAGYAVVTPLFAPGSALTAAGGAIFGPVAGSIYSLLGATLGATLSFLTARYLVGDAVRRRAGPKLDRLLRGVEEDGWRFVAIVRLVPLFPFNLSNYALGLTKIRLAPYVLTSLICMAPGAAGLAIVGHGGRAALGGESGALRWVLLGLGLVAAAVLLPRLLRKGAPPATVSIDALRETLPGGPAMLVLDVRSVEEFDGPLGHIPGARCIPVGELQDRLGDLEPERAARIVVVCRTDRRSTTAAELLASAGFPDVVVLAGGMEAWNAPVPPDIPDQ